MMNSTLHYSTPKLSVKDSFDDDEVSDDVEDEVFIRDGRSGSFKLDDEIGVKRPLMAPRRKFKYNQLNSERCKRPLHRRICGAHYGFGVLFLSIFLAVLFLFLIYLCFFPNPFDKFRRWKIDALQLPLVIPSLRFKSEHIWHQTFPFLKSESVMSTVDVNGDTFLDVVIGFSTGIHEGEMGEKCVLYGVSDGVCGGGVIALDGKTGAVLWKHWTRKDVLYIECSHSVNPEKTHDCLVSGRGGVLGVVDGKTGFIVWEFSKSPFHHRMDLYSAQYIFDLNDDGYADILISHTSDLASHLIILKGHNGEEIGQVETPNKGSIYTPPRVIFTQNKTYDVIFVTGDLDRPGAMFVIPLDAIALSDLTKCKKIWDGPSGITSDIVLSDINADKNIDLVFASGPTLNVISGSNYSLLWKVTSSVSSAQILIDPTPAYFDDDIYPDLLITELIGADYPGIYSRSRVLSGKDGKALLDEGMTGTGEITSPGLPLSFSGPGNDMFLYWKTTCNVQNSLQTQDFYFSQTTKPHEKALADLCKLRFNSTLETQLYVLSQHIAPPGVLLYSSKSEWDIEHNNSVGSYFTTKSDEKKDTPSSFRHKGQHSYQLTSENGMKKSYNNYPMYGEGKADRERWQAPQISYDGQFPMRIPNIALGELADAYYSQEMPTGEIGGALDEGRDERANYPHEMMKRHTYNQPSIIPRALSTGVLVNSVNGSGVDIVFATFWEVATNNVKIFTEKEQKCIDRKMEIEKNSNSLVNDDLARETAERQCSEETGGRAWTGVRPGLEEVPAGQLTLFRLRLHHGCTDLRPREICSTLLPYSQQALPQRTFDAFFKTRVLPTPPLLTR